MLFRLIARLQLYCPSLLYHSKYDSFRHILYKISKKIAKVKRPRFGTSDLFCKNIFALFNSYLFIILFQQALTINCHKIQYDDAVLLSFAEYVYNADSYDNRRMFRISLFSTPKNLHNQDNDY